MKVFMTGSSGLLASWIRPGFNREGIDIIGYDIKSGQDIFDIRKLERAMKGCDIVLHLAAYPSRDSAQTWEQFHHLNHEGAILVFEIAKKLKIKRFVYGSTGNVYCFGDGLQDDKEPPIEIEDTPDPDLMHPYPRSKLLTETYLKENRGTIQVIVLRPNHLAPTPKPIMELWRGATITRDRLVRYFVNACMKYIRNRYVILDVIEPTENYPGSLKAQELLD
jgi:nucleoside-diphosphate-sugar epimerase